MRRLKEGFYSIMKQANVIRDKPESKTEIIEFGKEKIQKPERVEAIISLTKGNADI